MADQELTTVAWLRVLNELELSLDAASRVATADASADETADDAADAAHAGSASVWQPPAGIGPIPAHLEERARDLLTCQQKLVGELDAARRLAGQHLAALRIVPPAREADRSVYLDVTG